MSGEVVITKEKQANSLDKLTTLFNEEIYLRVDASSVPVTKFKILDDILDFYKSNDQLNDAKEKISEHLVEHPESICARYLIGSIALIENNIEDTNHLKTLLEQFKNHSKWTIIEYITDNILQYGDQRMALKYKVEALEKLNKNKELKFVLEKLAKNDRKNPEVAKKYALSILEEDKGKSITYLKQAGESFARSKEYNQLEEIWHVLVQYNFEDIPFFEKIERILIGNREKTRVAILLYPLMDSYRQLEDWDKTILILKKILDQEPQSQKARNELLRAYKQKYKDHSLLDDFVRLSDIGNNKKPVKQCISSFERNIVFDTNNYVLHRNWGVGKITSISSSSDEIIVDFESKKSHRITIQMAINSLKPLQKEHIWVMAYENSEKVIEMFRNNPVDFVVELLKSNNNVMILADIKTEVMSRYIKKNEDWLKWWTKIKPMLKKDPRVGFSPKKKDEIMYRQKPMTLSEELWEKFNATTDTNKKIDIALEALENSTETEETIESLVQFYFEEEKAREPIRRILAYLFFDRVTEIIGSEDVLRYQKPADIEMLLRSQPSEELLNISKSISNVEIKKIFANLIRKHYPDYISVFAALLFEVPVKVNKHVFTLLVAEEKFEIINQFIEKALSRAKEIPEVFLWVAKSVLSKSWEYSWMNVSFNDLALRVFRLLKPLVKIEEKGTKLKNTSMDILFGNKNSVIGDVIKTSESSYIRKIYALFKEVPYIPDAEKEKLQELINKLKPDIQWSELILQDEVEERVSLLPTHGGVLVTQKGYNKKQEEFEHLVNVEMAENSRDIGEAQEKGDLRENAEYKAAMEKQSQLQALIKKTDHELKNAKIINIAEVNINQINIGCTVQLINLQSNETITYSILGPWDADTNKNIISYQSPLGASLLGKHREEVAKIDFDGNKISFKVVEISRYS